MVQNNAARLVARKKRRDRITPIMEQLHWLPVASRIRFKVCLLAFKAINGKAPPYIADMLSRYEPTRTLRSASRNLLVPKMPKLKTVGGRAFSVMAPQYWNKLPDHLRSCRTVEGFKSGLKTHLFREHYG